MRKSECNKAFETSRVTGTIRCKYRCTVTKFETETGKLGRTKEKITSTHTNQCRLIHNQRKVCPYPNDNEDTCHIPRK